MTLLKIVPENDITIYNTDGSVYITFKKGVLTWVFDGRGQQDNVYRRFRNMAFNRYGEICSSCGCSNKKCLRVCHIKSVEEFPNLYYDLDNVRINCFRCHEREHGRTLQGSKNNYCYSCTNKKCVI